MIPKHGYTLLLLIAVLCFGCNRDNAVGLNSSKARANVEDATFDGDAMEAGREFDAHWDNSVDDRIPGTASRVRVAKDLQIVEMENRPIFRLLLSRFSATSTKSSPESVILAGKVVNNNSGASQEGVPVFFGSDAHHPRLAALTDVCGEFRFRVWLCEERDDAVIDFPRPRSPSVPSGFDGVIFNSGMRTRQLASPALDHGVLYIGGCFDEYMELTSGFTCTYSLKELLAASHNATRQQVAGNGCPEESQN